MAYWIIKKLVIEKDAQARGAEVVAISQTGEKTVCQSPIQKLIPFETTTDNHKLSNNKPVNGSKRTDEMHILKSRRPTLKAKEEEKYLQELQYRYGWLFINRWECWKWCKCYN